MIARTHSFFQTRFFGLLGSLFLAALPSAALAQGENIGPDIRHGAQLSADQVATVTKFIASHSANLGGAENPQAIKRDRTALLEPLADSQASPAFRLKYSETLIPILTPLAKAEADVVVINSLVIAGDLATAQAVDLLAAGIKSTKPAIRFQAAYGLRRTFEALGLMATPTMRPDQAEEAIKLLAKSIESEADPIVTDGLVYALVQATQTTSLRNPAIAQLSAALSAKSKSLAGKAASGQLAQALLRGGAGVRDALGAAHAGEIPADTIKAAAELGGSFIAYCVKAIESKTLPMADKGRPEAMLRETHAQLATTAENVVLLALTLQGGKAPEARKIGDRLKGSTTSGDASFGEDARAIIGATGLLTKEPFRFAPTTFLDK